MLCKCLERKMSLIPDGSESELFGPFDLEYYLLESKDLYGDDSKENKTYGLEIVKRFGSEVEAETIKDFTSSREKARNVLNKLADNIVTPMYLYYIIDDLLAE